MRILRGGRRRKLAAACVVVAGLSMSAIAAQDATESSEQRLSRLLFEQARARMIAHGAGPVPLALDAYAARVPLTDAKSLLDRVSAGAAFPSAIDTSERLFERALENTYENLLLHPIACCLCTSTVTCNDNIFCNGAETCASGACSVSAPPCVDGNACTTDYCNEAADLCSWQPVPPPAEVSQLAVTRSAPGSPVASLGWSVVAGASAYNVYRGASSNLGDLACFQSSVAGNAQNDDGAMPIRAFFYLVTARACGESSLGFGNPAPRPPAPGCP